MIRRGVLAGALFMVGLLPTAAVDAQVVTGRVVAADTARGISGAFVQVFDQDDDRVVFGTTDAEGRFTLQLDSVGGPFRLQIDAFGYSRASMELPPVPPGDTLNLPDVAIPPEPIALDELEVQTDARGLPPGREWVRRHQLLGRGTFLSGAFIALDAPHQLGQYIADRTELWFGPRPGGGGRPVLFNPRGARSQCVSVRVNRWPLGRSGFRSIDDIPLDWIAAIEIYEAQSDVPDRYAIEWPGNCGLVQVWLWNSW